MKSLFRRFVKNESGATAIEYGLLAAFISLVVVAVGPTLKDNLNSVFGAVQTGLQSAVPPTTPPTE